MKDFLKNNIKFIIVMTIAVVAMILTSVHILSINNKLYTSTKLKESDGAILDFKKGDVVEQKFKAKENNFSKIKLYFELPDDSIGTAKLQLKDENGNIVKEEEIIKNYLQYGYDFKFDNQQDSEGKFYTLSITFEEAKDNRKFFGLKTVSNTGEHFSINGKENKKSLVFQEFYYKPHKKIMYIIATIIVILTMVGLASYIKFTDRKLKPEKIFLITVPIIGVFYIIAMPTYRSHDELYHWYRAYEVSMGVMNEQIEDGALGTVMPEAVRDFMTVKSNQITYDDFKESINTRLDETDISRIYSETQAVYSFVSYIPQAIGIFVARHITSRAMLVAYAGRFVNLACSLAFLYLAIKNIPFGKNIVLLMSYIPIALEGVASLSADALTISMSALYISYVLKLAFDNKVESVGIKQLGLLTIMSIVVALCKIVYIPFVFLTMLIPKEKFKDRKKWIKIIAVMLIAIIVNLLWLKKASQYLAYFRDADSSYQVKNILSNPIRYVQIVLYTLNNDFTRYFAQMFGKDLGWGEFVNISYLIPMMLGGLAIWIFMTDKEAKPKLNRYSQLVIAFVVLSIIALIFTSLYVQWTPVNRDEVWGIQGRYFIPLLPLIAILIGCNLQKVKSDYRTSEITKLVGITGTTIQIFSILQIFIFNL